jgi:O-antigen ligase
MIKKQSWGSWLTLFTTLAIFSCALVVYKLVNACFYLLLLIAILMWAFQKNSAESCWAICKKYWPLHLAMCAALIAVLLHQLAQAKFSIRLYDLPSRLALFGVMFWLMLQMPLQLLEKIKWGFICGALLYVISLYIHTEGGKIHISTVNSFSVIFSSELALLMGVFSLLSIGWVTGQNTSSRAFASLTLALQIAAGLAGLVAVYLSQSRGAWLAVPFMAVLVTVTLLRKQATRSKVFVCLIFLVALLTLAFSTPIVQDRLREAKNDLVELTTKENWNSSIGYRFQLWNASWIMFTEHPMIGVGKENFSRELHTLNQRGVITAEAAEQYHSHNELLYGMSTLGIMGLLAILMTYFAPAYYFGKYLFHADRGIQCAAAMGISLCLGYIIFGLVDVMYGWNMCNVFYCLASAVLLAFIVNRHNDLSSHQ